MPRTRANPLQQPNAGHRADDVVGAVDAPVEVAPARFTTALVHCVLIPEPPNASNCNSPDGACSTTGAAARPSCSVRYMVSPSPIISVVPGGDVGHQPGSVTDAATTWQCPPRVELLAQAATSG